MEKWVDVEPAIFIEMLDKAELDPAQVIDVREQQEWDYYHLDGSALIPTSVMMERIAELPHDKPLYIICAHGVRSVAVCRYLSERAGYDNLHNVAGGMAAVSAFYGFQYD